MMAAGTVHVAMLEFLGRRIAHAHDIDIEM
jgi:hypothetical protein